MAATLTVKEVAEQLGTTPRLLRKFLRDEVTEKGGTVGEDTPGKGGRYLIEARSVRGLTKRYTAWAEARTPAQTEETADEPTDEVDEVAETEV